MQSYEFFDIHTHNPANRPGVLEVVNLRLPHCIECNEKWYSAGVHPYDITSENEVLLPMLSCFSSTCVVAIGETGLDFRFLGTIVRQREYFIQHIEIANQRRLPLIVHCVRALPETLAIIRRNLKSSFVIHGFASNASKAKIIFDAGGFISIGPLMLKNRDCQRYIKQVFSENSDKILLETDDAQISIEEVYARVSTALEWNIDKLKDKIANNFTMLYGGELSQFSK